MSQFLDCFSQEDIVELLKKQMLPKRKLAVYSMETYWDNQKTDAEDTVWLQPAYLYLIANVQPAVPQKKNA
jgi:hypothetical protein